MRKLIVVAFIISTACAQNVYEGASNPNSDTALYNSAQYYMNFSDWDNALLKFQTMTPTALTSREIALTYATALAGKCGFNYLDFLTALGASSIGSGIGQMPMFYWLMQAYQGKTVNLLVSGVATPSATTDTYCSWAQEIMDQIKTNYGSWNNKEKGFVVMFSLAKVGMILRGLADTDGAGNLGNGTMDNTFDACDSTTDFTDFYAKQLSTGFALVVQNYSGILGGSFGASVAAIAALCADFPAGLGLTVCSHTTPATVTANDMKNARALIMMSKISASLPGVGAINDDVTMGVANDPAVGSYWVCSGSSASAPPNPVFNCCP